MRKLIQTVASFIEEQEVRREWALPIRECDMPSPIRQHVMRVGKRRKLVAFMEAIACCMSNEPMLVHRYPFDDHDHPNVCQLIIVAPPGTGKSIVTDIKESLYAALKAMDKPRRIRSNEYKEKKSCKGDKEKMEKRPLTPLFVLSDTISRTALIKMIGDSEDLFGCPMNVTMQGDEIANFIDARRNTYSDIFNLLRNGFDKTEVGQDYVTENSCSRIVKLGLNFNFCATPGDLFKLMSNSALTGGICSRVAIVEMDEEIGAKPSVSKPLTEKQQEEIAQALQRMKDANFIDDDHVKDEIRLDGAWIFPYINKWVEKVRQEVVETNSVSLDVLRKRPPVIANRMTMQLYHLYLLEGISERVARKRCIKIFDFLANYILDTAMRLWGSRYEELQSKQQEEHSPSSRKNLLALCTDPFTRDQLTEIMKREKKRSPVKSLICIWKKNDMICEIEKGVYRNLRYPATSTSQNKLIQQIASPTTLSE